MSGTARDAVEGGRLRRLGYRLLPGEGFSYLLHLRPREWPIMVVHTLCGVVLAQGMSATAGGAHAAAIVAGVAIWVGLLNGGTLALNSAFDRDVGDIGYLDAPPPPPAHLAGWGVGLMLVGQGLSLLLPRAFAIAYAACLAMSVVYSVPPLRLKAVAGADWIINMVGFGAVTPYAGWSLTGMPLTSAGAWALGGFAPLFASLYPLTQLYQLEEDRRRGDRTLALRLGARGSLVVSITAAVVAFGCFARAAVLVGARARGTWAAIALGLAAVAWMAVLVPWLVRAPALSVAAHKRGMYAALGAWAITDVAVLLAIAP